MFRDDTFLARWLSGELSDSEKQEFEQSPEYKDYQQMINTLATLKAPSFNEEKAYRTLHEKTSNQPRRGKSISLLRWLQASAALVFLGLLIWFLLPNQGVVLKTQLSENRNFVLPDGTKVTMRGKSTIHFFPKRWPQERSLDLEGEAFFQVKPGSTFTIKSKVGKVVVIGTSFNVLARDSTLAVQCIHGKVKVISNSQKARPYLLEQGDFAQLYTSTEHSPPNATQQFPLSQQGQSSFYAASFEEVLTKIEIQFNVVVLNKEKYHSRRFTGVFRNEDLELALNMICIPMELKYTIVQDQVYLEDK